ncbi:MAG TPA: AAA family ATPase, partial [Myxococcales bacterium]|nr:AAA family ATPase [Myxococcales bacterium]
MLEGAVGRAANGQFYEVVVEHVLHQFLSSEDGDAARILHRFEVDRQRLSALVERIFQRMRTGNAGRPVFSETVFQWFEDAWLFASVELGAVQLRTGALLAMLIARPEKYTAETFADLERVPFDELKKDFDEIVSQSPESAEVAAVSTGGGAPTPGAPGGRGDEALKRFATNFTDKARQGGIDPIFGRHREIRQMVDILARRRKNNPIIVGEPGVGKTALVEGLAVEIANGQVPESLKTVELYGLDLGLLQAGAGVKGEFENRLKAVIQEVKSSPRPIILFIDEAHTLIGAGGAQGGSDAANLLKPALARGELRTIAATTWSEYKKYFEKDAALERRFQPVKVEEPSEEDAIGMLRGIRDLYEKTHNVVIRDDALVAAVKLSQRYISGRLLPDKAVDLLDTASARVKMELHSRPEEVVALEAELAGLEREKGALIRDRDHGQPVEPKAIQDVEEKIRGVQDQLATFRARWEAERAAVAALHEARKPGTAPAALEEAKAALAKARGESPLVHPEVDPDVIARVVASWTGVPVGKMRSDMLEAILQLEERLRGRVRGQDAALKTVAEAIRIAHAGIRNPSTPVGVLLFVGPSGVGKTETAI